LLEAVLSRKLKEGNHRVNRELATCMEKAKISKEVTYHCSRHTFAINCILLGIDIITVRDWLGHKSVTTTEIYAKIAEQFKDRNMKKWDNFGKLKVA
jgi:integrase/recombinase XerD